MLKKNELKVIKLLLNDFTRQWTIREIAKALRQNYFQTYMTITGLEKTKEVVTTTLGKSRIVQLDLEKYHAHYIIAEIERAEERNFGKLSLVIKQLVNIQEYYICLLFGSQVVQQKNDSDIDLLFVISDTANISVFEKEITRILSPYNCDINIVTEKSLFEMWSSPKKLNVGNEILKKHIILYGAEHFMVLLRKHYVR
ncbi:MAG: hypothetical protein AABX82_00050 [Nanoarchaeota archaeon]